MSLIALVGSSSGTRTTQLRKVAAADGQSMSPDIAQLIAGAGVGGIGGAAAGIGAGMERGHPIAGGARGTIRGAATGLGSVSGAMLAKALGLDGPLAQGLGGALGGGAGYGLSGMLLGKPKRDLRSIDDYTPEKSSSLVGAAGGAVAGGGLGSLAGQGLEDLFAQLFLSQRLKRPLFGTNPSVLERIGRTGAQFSRGAGTIGGAAVGGMLGHKLTSSSKDNDREKSSSFLTSFAGKLRGGLTRAATGLRAGARANAKRVTAQGNLQKRIEGLTDKSKSLASVMNPAGPYQAQIAQLQSRAKSISELTPHREYNRLANMANWGANNADNIVHTGAGGAMGFGGAAMYDHMFGGQSGQPIKTSAEVAPLLRYMAPGVHGFLNPMPGMSQSETALYQNFHGLGGQAVGGSLGGLTGAALGGLTGYLAKRFGGGLVSKGGRIGKILGAMSDPTNSAVMGAAPGIVGGAQLGGGMAVDRWRNNATAKQSTKQADVTSAIRKLFPELLPRIGSALRELSPSVAGRRAMMAMRPEIKKVKDMPGDIIRRTYTPNEHNWSEAAREKADLLRSLIHDPYNPSSVKTVLRAGRNAAGLQLDQNIGLGIGGVGLGSLGAYMAGAPTKASTDKTSFMQSSPRPPTTRPAVLSRDATRGGILGGATARAPRTKAYKAVPVPGTPVHTF